MAAPRVSQIRKYLKELDAESLMSEMERILERFPEAKKFYLADLSGDTKAIVKTARTQIERCFKTSTGKWRRARSSKLNSIIRDFERVSVFGEDLLDLHLFRLEHTTAYLNEFKPSESPLIASSMRTFESACTLAKDLQLEEKYKPHLVLLISRFDDRHIRRQLDAIFYSHFRTEDGTAAS
jgi:hypothetical protein